MNLAVLAALVVLGVSALVLAVHLTGGSKRAVIASPVAARLRFLADFPDDAPDETIITLNRETAFLPLAGGAIGIVHVIGDGFLTRRINSSSGARTVLVDPSKLLLVLDDFTWVGGEFMFAKAADAERIAAILAFRPETSFNAASNAQIANNHV